MINYLVRVCVCARARIVCKSSYIELQQIKDRNQSQFGGVYHDPINGAFIL